MEVGVGMSKDDTGSDEVWAAVVAAARGENWGGGGESFETTAFTMFKGPGLLGALLF